MSSSGPAFGEYALPTDTLAAILGQYPFSVGLFRELLQNTDDARGTKQVFVLDTRNHGTSTLLHGKLSDTQGPALLAYNDALFSEEDWDALQSIHRSSKKTDSSKIGKYGIGFRSCYHITDNPQIISGPTLAVLDPHHNFTSSGGTRLEFVPKAVDYKDQLDAFGFFLGPDARDHAFPGSIIRLPLRKPGAQSSISSKSVDPKEILQLFDDFIREEEIGISLLFLKNVTSVEIHQVDEQGNSQLLAKSSISKTEPTSWTVGKERYTSFQCITVIETPKGRIEKKWRIVHSYFSEADSQSLLAFRLGHDPRPVLAKHKLLSEMAIAMPMSILDAEEKGGRLFTYLPLPLRTGFPGHVHALFALTASRQNLNNGGEIGIVKGSEDSVLVEWNYILFESFLPRTWAALLPVLIQQDRLGDIFRAWPPSQTGVFGGDTAYWQTLPAKLLECIVGSKAAVWPVAQGSTSKEQAFAELGSVLVVSTDVDDTTVLALADAGLRLTKLPEHVAKLLPGLLPTQYTLLSPIVAHGQLLNHVNEIQTLDAAQRATILQYLLRKNELENIVKLPLLPLVDGSFLAPVKSGLGRTVTMMDQLECDIFGKLEASAVALPAVAPSIRELLRTDGPLKLNLALLSAERVAGYLRMSPLGFDLTRRHEGNVQDALVSWLNIFWAWIVNWPSRDELFPHISTLSLVPAYTSLESPETGVFSGHTIDPPLQNILRGLGLAFLHPSFSAEARKGLGFYPLVIKSVFDVHLVLDRMSVGSDVGRLATEQLALLSKHVVDCVIQTGPQRPLNETQQSALRSLPIFPLLQPSVVASPPPVVEEKPVTPKRSSIFKLPTLHRKSKSSTVAIASPVLSGPPQFKSIPLGAHVYGIPSGTTVLLPVVENSVYVDGTHVDLRLLSHVAPSTPTPLLALDILNLAIEHFVAQKKSLRAAYLDHIVRHRDSLPPNLLRTIQQIPFVPVSDNTIREPEYIIDPTNPELLDLYADNPDRLPQTTNNEDAVILRHLRTLGLITAALTAEMATERIQYISSHATSPQTRTLALFLLTTLNSGNIDCSELEIPHDAKWLPTVGGPLVTAAGCFDVSRRPELFDEVVPVLDTSVAVSPSLRTKLGWSDPIPFSTLCQQFRAVVIGGATTAAVKLDCLIREFSTRTLSDDDIAELVAISAGREWIPLAPGRLISSELAIFSSTLGLRGFHRIPVSLQDQPKIKEFLVRMGCAERPSPTILAGRLKTLELVAASRDIVDEAIALLNVLVDDLRSVKRAQILVPDSNGALHPVSEVYFNDVGDRACLIDIGKRYIAHPKISDELSKRLVMDRLGFASIEITPGIDMGESLTTTIRNTLKQYTEAQILNEFLANAEDAGATKFSILVDDYSPKADKLLSAALAPFVSCPSVVFYNDAQFTTKDFDGICRTGIGGKTDRSNTVGQFGLGALTMFHYTELAMIVSGNHARDTLPEADQLNCFQDEPLCCCLWIKFDGTWYPDHLQSLDGLFDFSMKQGAPYNGTIFRLPLRRQSHLNQNSILTTTRNLTPQSIWDKVVSPFKRTGHLSLLFTRISQIATFSRDARAQLHGGWKLTATRDPMETVSTSIATQIVHIRTPFTELGTDDYKIVLSTRPLSELPNQYSGLVGPNKLRSPITVALAAPLFQTNVNQHIFSTLPLPMMSTLPVHLNASFILTPDRRNVRLDEYAESKYNRWLLGELAPPLYLFLLEDLLRTGARLGNAAWWPGNVTTQDAVSQVLVDAFYSASQLGSTKRRICASPLDSQQFRPSDVLLGGNEPAAISKVLAAVDTSIIVRLPPKVQERAASTMKALTPAVVAKELKDRSRTLSTLFLKGEISTRDVQGVVDYLAEDSTSNLDGLTLLPLANGKLAAFKTGGSPAYHVWKATTDRELFKPEFLVAPDFNPTKVTTGLNVVKDFSYTSMETLIKEHFKPATDRQLPPAEEQWVKVFWAEFTHFGLPAETKFTTFPMVPTTRQGYYVSLAHCWTTTVILISNSEPYFLANVLTQLGMSVVNRDSKELPKALREQLRSYTAFSFDRILQYLKTVESSIPSRFNKLTPAAHAEFAEWARGRVLSTPEYLVSIAAALPIWKKLQKDEETTLHKASDLKMLPFGISRGIASHFMGVPTTEHNPALVHLKVVPMDFNTFWSHLKLPNVLSAEEQQPYKQLLTAMPTNFIYDPETILIPDGYRHLVKAKTLYVRHALFVAAFGSDNSPSHFVLDSFRDLEPRLVLMGMKSHSNLDVDTFKECARAIQAAADSNQPNVNARARVVFNAYSQDVPLRITSATKHLWQDLDRLRFVPREPLRSRTMRFDDTSPYVKPLPAIVSPDQVVLPEHESVAWTQRAVLSVTPDERLLHAHMTFGQPTVKEVVAHLRVLALKVAKDFTSDIYVLADLQATYKYLDDFQDEAEDIISVYHDEPLFLNVEDPKTDPWVFHCADEMFFNILDGGDLKSVKKFLQPFRDLLAVTGVEDIVQIPIPKVEQSSVETQLAMLRTGFESMRAEGKLTDVVFVCDDESRQLAHRAFVAPMSEYLSDLFLGSFTEAGPGTAEEPVEVEVDYPGQCVAAVLDYMYTVKAPTLERLDDLLDVMDLANYWGLNELNLIVQTQIISKSQISPATYEDVLARATELEAKLLLDACTFFERENHDAIMRLKGKSTGKRRAPKRIPKKFFIPSPGSGAAGTSKTNGEASAGRRSSKLIQKAPKSVAKGIIKGLRKVGDTIDFLS
ncbi:BTB domain-containing protein [Mycena chlorophos]|uniref:BTB domain-containing protein n=1 Tax=Mycena chlorophos TaxID=658473 RepID=A0A8H6TQ99_MYCCL|nr:BTB domain-containing protein [Mycena chlorophos]